MIPAIAFAGIKELKMRGLTTENFLQSTTVGVSTVSAVDGNESIDVTTADVFNVTCNDSDAILKLTYLPVASEAKFVTFNVTQHSTAGLAIHCNDATVGWPSATAPTWTNGGIDIVNCEIGSSYCYCLGAGSLDLR